MKTVENIKQIGFVKVANWVYTEKGLTANLGEKGALSNVTYAFVVDGIVMYFGRPLGTLQKECTIMPNLEKVKARILRITTIF